MRSVRALAIIALLTGCRSTPAPAAPASAPSGLHAFALVAEADRLAGRDLWPGFDLRAVPMAIFDGERTLLFRHPAPPAGFQAVPGRGDAWSYPGRHPNVTANSSTDVGGVLTATLMPAMGAGAVPRWAGVLIHEAFHVYQRQHHPAWSANEVELFTYPLDDPEVVGLQRMESEALRRSLTARDHAQAACWARTGLDHRWDRFALIPEGAAGYERGTEWNEGLASYVEGRATGLPDSSILPQAAFAPEAIRQRGYATGTALARLLDRFSPTWRASLEQNDSTPLDVLLSGALRTPESRPAGCQFTAPERNRIRSAAAADVDALRARRTEQRRSFLEQPGWRLTIAAPGAPLFPQNFDPLNVQTVGPGEVLHTRWIKLGNGAGMVEVLGRSALTVAAGTHPLFNGVRTLNIGGLASQPVVTVADGVVAVKADGVTAALRGATVQRTGQSIIIQLPSTQ